MNRLDITSEFRHLDFLEAHLFFEVRRCLLPVQIFPVWGAELVTNKNWPTQLSMPSVNFDATKDSAYCAGFSWLEFHGVVGAEIEVLLYENSDEFVRGNDKKPFAVTRKWDSKELEEAWRYEFLAVLDWPYGYCDLKIWAKSRVLFHFPPEKLIPASTYIKDPQRWAYNGEDVPNAPFAADA